jgi:nucleotide-binding universal stress UspA family protein
VLIFFEGLAVWLAIVLVCMLVVAYLSRRWGHDPFGWMFLSAAIGPFAIIALVGTRHRDRDIARTDLAPTGAPGRVIIACDGSEVNGQAAAYAAVAYPGVEFVLLTVEAHEAEPRAPEEEVAQSRRLEATTGPAMRALEAAGRHARALTAYGNAGEEILRLADREQAAAIVVGRRGVGLTRALLGSVSDHIVRNAKQPVVVVS